MSLPRRSFLIVAIALVVAAGCVWLGVWQLSRWSEKSFARNALERSLASAGSVLGDSLPPESEFRDQVVEVRGTFDPSWHLLLTGRLRNDLPGVRLVTPLRVGSREILVDRGWIPSEDASDADPGAYDEPGLRRVRAFAEVPKHRPAAAWRRQPNSDSLEIWQARWIDLDTVAVRRGTRLARLVLTELPESTTHLPARDGPELPDPGMHLSYAIQWFAFAAIALVGSFFLAGFLPSRR